MWYVLGNVLCFAERWSKQIDTFFLHISISVEVGECVCECMCIELKADLMSCEAVELRHGSVTHHRTFGSHGGLIIRGILWSLSIIKINHHPAAGRLSVVVCSFSPLFVFLSFSLLTISPSQFIFLSCSCFLCLLIYLRLVWPVVAHLLVLEVSTT